MKSFVFQILIVFGAFSTANAQLLVASEAVYPQLKGVEVYQSEEQIIFMVDGAQIKAIAQLHEALQIGLQLPAFYGKNLDALYDVLTDRAQTPVYVRFVFQNSAQLKANLGAEQFDALIATIRDAKANRHNLELETL